METFACIAFATVVTFLIGFICGAVFYPFFEDQDYPEIR